MTDNYLKLCTNNQVEQKFNSMLNNRKIKVIAFMNKKAKSKQFKSKIINRLSKLIHAKDLNRQFISKYNNLITIGLK